MLAVRVARQARASLSRVRTLPALQRPGVTSRLGVRTLQSEVAKNLSPASIASPMAPQPGRRLDLSSAAALLASLRELIPGCLKSKSDVTAHMPLLVVNLLSGATLQTAFSACALQGDAQGNATGIVDAMERRESVRGTAAAFAKRAAAAGPSGVHAKEHDALVTHQSAPGGAVRYCVRSVALRVISSVLPSFSGGKTALLELLAQLSSTGTWGRSLCDDDATRATLNESIPITVTFNAGMPASHSSYDADPQTGLALRILYSALVQSHALSFVDFWAEYFPVCATLDVNKAIKCCQIAFGQLAPSRRGILLLVDETAKLSHASGPHSAVCMLTALGSLLDLNDPRKLNIVCSTLDALLLNALRTASGRAIAYVPLPELTQGTAEALFATALVVTPEAGPLPPSIRIAISDCAGHVRTLEHLLRAVKAARPGPQLDDLRNRTVAEVIADETPQWAVRAALRGDELMLTDVVPDSGGVLFGSAISSGTFINTSAFGSSAAVPKLSMMYILRFANAQTASSPLISPIRGMAAAEENASNLQRPSLGGEPFELFVAHFLGLLAALEDGSTRSLRQLFHVLPAELSKQGLPHSVRNLLRRPCSRDSDNHRLAHWPSLTFSSAASVVKSSCAELADAGIFSFRRNNPGFDLLYLSAAMCDKTRFAIAIEARLTTPGGSTGSGRHDCTDSLDDVEKKVALVRLDCGSGGAFRKLRVEPNNVLFVYLAARTIVGFDAAARAAFLARGVVVLDRQATEVFLSRRH